jgi:7,8-dihydropterin-6-yl-methyl-4-(beta-D-ribofuranosyl)aminobenzene 5'-phosphate synthase
MQRRQILMLGAVGSGVFAVGGLSRLGARGAAGQAVSVPTVDRLDPDYVIPMHCTGLDTIMAVHREMPAKLMMPSTGTRVVFGA